MHNCGPAPKRLQRYSCSISTTPIRPADLERVRSMGAIRRFFSGLDEDKLRHELANIRMRIRSSADSLQAQETSIAKIERQLSALRVKVYQLQEAAQRSTPESECRNQLEQKKRRLDQLESRLRDIVTEIDGVRERLFGKCRVLATTVYQSYLKDEVGKRYDVVIIDEASMLLLPMVCYVSGLASQAVIVAGDFRQLPPIVKADKVDICKKWLKRDVFYAAGIAKAVARNRYPVNLVPLEEQFRMPEEICNLVSRLFYGNWLKTAPAVLAREHRNPFGEPSKALLYVDTSEWNPWTACRLGTYSRYNILHALVIARIVAKLQTEGFLGSGEVNERLGIVSPYRAQTQLIARLVEESLGVRGSLYAATVHRFQGNERDVMVCDLTDSMGLWIGRFAKAVSLDEDGAKLLNVALSRARHCNLLVANFSYLQDKLPQHAIARDILAHFERNGMALDVSDCLPFQPEAILAAHDAVTATSALDVGPERLKTFSAGTFNFLALHDNARHYALDGRATRKGAVWGAGQDCYSSSFSAVTLGQSTRVRDYRKSSKSRRSC